MTVSAGRIKDIANIQKLGHIEFRTTDLERARDFYVNLIGLHETARDDNRVYLRCTEDKQHHTFVLRKADSAGVGHIGFMVAEEGDLDRMKLRFEELGLPTRWAGNEMLGQGRTLRVQDRSASLSITTPRSPRCHGWCSSITCTRALRRPASIMPMC